MSAYQSAYPMGRIVHPLVRKTDCTEEVRQKSFAVTLYLVGLVLTGIVALVWHVILTHDNSELVWVIADEMLVYSAAVTIPRSAFAEVCTHCLLDVYQWGLTSFIKIFFIVNAYCWLTMASIIGPFTGGELWHVLILVTYALLHVLSESDLGLLDIHPFEVEISPPTRFICCSVHILLNFSMMKSYAVSAQIEAHHVNETVQVASRIAYKRANFDLDGVDTLRKNPSELQKRCIEQGRASEADISFYFAHWITDLAGAEVFGSQPWLGADKFVLKFPLKVDGAGEVILSGQATCAITSASIALSGEAL